ncbi:MAG TPA: PspC domain-containing protein [Ornithinicoccus sp.]|nr:PspC domain-containing protein [Ornithinicoccus sp.]
MTQTTPGGQQGGQPSPQGSDTFFEGLRRIDMRRSDDSWFGGVASGLAERLGVDPLVIRALFVVLSLGMGLGVLLYLTAWLLIPDRREQTHIEKALRGGEAASVVLLVAAVLSLFGAFGWAGGGWWDRSFFPWSLVTLVIVGLGAWWLWTEWSRRAQPGFYSRTTTSMHAAPPYAGGPTDTSTAAPGYPGAPDSTTGATAYPSGGEGPAGATAWTPGASEPLQTPAGTQPFAAYRPSPVPPRPVVPPAPRRPSRKSAGAAGTLLGTGLALVTAGGLAWAAWEYDWSVNPWLVGLAGALGVLGLVILLLGLAGRTSGIPGFLAIVALLGTVAFLPVADHFVPSGRVGDYHWTLGPAATESSPYRVGAGTGTLDLRGVDPEDLSGETIQASVGFGRLNILVPDDLTVQIDAGVGFGAISRDGPSADQGGVNVTNDIVVGDGPVDLTIEAHVGFGQILVEGN